MTNAFDGSLISLEGLDGAGTTTLAENLKEELPEYEFTQEPSHGKYGRIVREELQSEDDPTLSDFFLFLADRFDHCDSLIGPKLSKGTNVITDRYDLSTYAYQSRVVEEDLGIRRPYDYISDVSDYWVIEPDLTLYIDISPGESLERISEEREKYEVEERLRGARKVYDDHYDLLSYVERIDGTQSEEDVLEEALGHIEDLQ